MKHKWERREKKERAERAKIRQHGRALKRRLDSAGERAAESLKPKKKGKRAKVETLTENA